MPNPVRVWREADVIPALAPNEFIFLFKVAVEAGRPVNVISASCNNDTRPTADPREAFVWKGTQGDDAGDSSSSMILAIGFVSSFGDLIVYFPKEFRLEINEQIGFKVLGDDADVVQAKVMYELLEK